MRKISGLSIKLRDLLCSPVLVVEYVSIQPVLYFYLMRYTPTWIGILLFYNPPEGVMAQRLLKIQLLYFGNCLIFYECFSRKYTY